MSANICAGMILHPHQKARIDPYLALFCMGFPYFDAMPQIELRAFLLNATCAHLQRNFNRLVAVRFVGAFKLLILSHCWSATSAAASKASTP